MSDRSDVRARLIRECVRLMRERGVDGFGVAELLAESGVARQSLYKYFPGGKAELVAAATADAVSYLTHVLDRTSAERDPAAVIAAWAEWWQAMLEASDYGVGCPMAAASLVGERYPAAAQHAALGFDVFRDRARESFEAGGVAPERAVGLASVAVSAIEGAIIAARSARSVAPLDHVVEHFQALLAGEVLAGSAVADGAVAG